MATTKQNILNRWQDSKLSDRQRQLSDFPIQTDKMQLFMRLMQKKDAEEADEEIQKDYFLESFAFTLDINGK